jgi:hypothetical protein
MSDGESSRYHKETKFLGKRFSSKGLNYTADLQPQHMNVNFEIKYYVIRSYLTFIFYSIIYRKVQPFNFQTMI